MLLAILHIFRSEWFRTTWLEYFHICVCVSVCLLLTVFRCLSCCGSFVNLCIHSASISLEPIAVVCLAIVFRHASDQPMQRQHAKHTTHTHIIISLPSATLSVHIFPLLCLHHSGAWLGLTRTHKEWSTVPDLTGVYNRMTSRLSGCLRAIMHSIQSFINQCGSAYGMLIARYMPGSPFSCIKYT